MQIAAEVLFNIGPLPITNTVTSALLLDTVLLTFAFILRGKLSLIPGKLQSIFELIYDFVHDLAQSVLPHKYMKPVMPWILSFFVVIMIGNWMGLLPGMESIYLKEDTHQEIVLEESSDAHSESAATTAEKSSEETEVHHKYIFRGMNADLNTTMALTLVAFLVVNVTTLYYIGIKGWFKHYFHTKPIYLIGIFVFVGLLEILLDPVKFLSLGLRLFGNIFAGETLIGVMTAIPGIAVPFLILEIMIGIIQALIFTGLSLTFLSVMVSGEEEHN